MMAISLEMVKGCKEKLHVMHDAELIIHYMEIRQSGFIFEKEAALEEILYRMQHGSGGAK